MATSTGTPWNLPSPDLPEQPHGPAQMAALADAVHVALGRAFPCLSTARPPAQEGMLIFETDTDTLLVSPDGTNWRTLLSTPTVTGGIGGSPGTVERTDVLTAQSGWAVSTQRFYKQGGVVCFTAAIQRTGTTITSNTTGNITNTSMATIAAGWRPPLGNWQIGGGGSTGNMMVGYVSENGTMAVGALLPTPAGDYTSTSTHSWSGMWPCGDG